MRIPGGGVPNPPTPGQQAAPQLPEFVVASAEWVTILERVLEISESLVATIRDLMQVQLELRQQIIDANQAAITFYSTLRNVYSSMPSMLAAYGEMSGALANVTQAFTDVAVAAGDTARAFYDFVGNAVQAGNASAIITGGLSAVASAFSGLSRLATVVQESFNRIVNVFSNAMNAISKPIENALTMVNSLSESMNTFFNQMSSSLTRGLDAISNALSTYGEGIFGIANSFGIAGEAADFFASSMRAVVSQLSDITKMVIQIYSMQFQYFIKDLQIAFTELQKRLQPILLELTKFQQMLQVVGQILGFVTQIVSTLAQALGQLVGLFGNFVNTWLNMIQALAPVQQNLNLIGLNVINVNEALSAGAQVLDTYRNAITALVNAYNQANLSLTAIFNTVRNLNSQGIIPTTQNIQQLSSATNELARQLGVLPDELMEALTGFATGGETLRQYLPTLTQGALQLAMIRQLGLPSLPAPMMIPFAAGFAQRAVRELFPTGEAPATLVQFTQALRSIGQLFQAALAQAQPFGGTQILSQIRNILQEFVQGEVGNNLRTFLRWASTGIARGLQDFLSGLRDFVRSPVFQEIGRGIGMLAYAIGAAVGSILRQLSQLQVDRVAGFMMNFAASVYALIMAGFTFVQKAVFGLIQWFSSIFGAGGTGIFGFLSAIIGIVTTGVKIGTSLLDLTHRVAISLIAWFQVVADNLTYYSRIAAQISAALQVIVGALIIVVGVLLAPKTGIIGGLITIGAGIGIMASGVWAFLESWFRNPQEIMKKYGLQEAAAQIASFGDVVKNTNAELEKTRFTLPNIQAANQALADTLDKAAKEAQKEYITRKQAMLETLNAQKQFNDAVEEGAERFRRAVYQYVQPFFNSLIDLADAITEQRRLLRPIAPGVSFTPVRVGDTLPSMMLGGQHWLVLMGGALPSFAALESMIPRQMQAALIAHNLEILRSLPPEQLAGVPAGEYQRLIRELTQMIQRDLQTMGQAISDEMSLVETRLQYFEQTARLRAAMGLDAVATAATRLSQGMRAATMSAYGLGAAFVALDQIRQAYPGIERTAEFQAVLNQLIQAQVDLLDRAAQRWVRVGEIARRYTQVVGEGFAEMVAWGYELHQVWMALDNLARGQLIPGVERLIEAGLMGLRPIGAALVVGFRATWMDMLAQIAAESRRAFAQLLAGNVEQFLENLRQLQQRILQLPEDFLQRVRNAFNIALRPIAYFNEVLSDIRNTLSTIGAEMALFPYVLTRVIPVLVDMRNQFAAAAEQAYRLGDILSFSEALRNVAQLQRQIMELLGITGIFLPAYTPEQMLRMFIRIGMPTQREVIELMRGGLLVEPAQFRAVPIPLAQFFGLPAPAAMRLTPDIFGGYPMMFAGLGAISPELMRLEYRRLQMMGMEQMRGAAYEAEGIRDILRNYWEMGRQVGLLHANVFRRAYASIEQGLRQAITAQFGEAGTLMLPNALLPPPPLSRGGITSPLEGIGAFSPQQWRPGGWGRIPTVLDNDIARMSEAARQIAETFANLNFRLRTEPISLTIPISITVVDAQSREVLAKIERNLYIKLSNRQA